MGDFKTKEMTQHEADKAPVKETRPVLIGQTYLRNSHLIDEDMRESYDAFVRQLSITNGLKMSNVGSILKRNGLI